MRVYLGSDHAGFELKQRIADRLHALGHDVVDCGARRLDPEDDYPPFVLRAAASVAADPGSRGVVLGGSGNGEAIAANKVDGVRAVLVWNEETARLGREHNDANVISLGARLLDPADAVRYVEIFLATDFSDEPRHVRRIAMLHDYERTGELPAMPAD